MAKLTFESLKSSLKYGDGGLFDTVNHGKPCYLYVYFENGHKYRKFFSHNESGLKEIQKLIDFQRQKKSDGITGTEKTLEQMIISYLRRFKLNKIRSSSYQRYIDTLYNINKKLLNQKFDSIKLDQIQDALNEIEQRVSVAESKKAFILLKAVFRNAVDNDIIIKSPFRNLEAPTYKPKEKEIFSGPELKAIFSAIHYMRLTHKTNRTHDYDLLFTFLLYSGVRINELLAIRWSDITWGEKPFISIQRTLDSHFKGKGQKTNAPKTYAGLRDIPLHRKLVRMLSRIRPQKENCDDYIFATESGLAMTSNNVYRTWYAIQRATARECPHCHTERPNSWKCESCGNIVDHRAIKCECGNNRPKSWECPNCKTVITEVHHKIHDWRHTFISCLANRHKIPISIIKYLAGHSTYSTTLNVYTHKPDNYYDVLEASINHKKNNQ